MKGLGFLIWNLKSLLPLDATIAKLQKAGVSWVSIKFLDGTLKHNLIDALGNKVSNDAFLKYVIERFRAAGIEVGGWQFIYTRNSSPLVRQAEEANKVIRLYNLSHWLVDAEEVLSVGAQWKTHPDRFTDAKIYMDSLNVDIPIGLCSYRFPSYHRNFPFAPFVKHPKNTIVTQQMYWMQATNPGAQLSRSVAEYNAIRPLPNVPIGAAFREWGWEPTVAQLKEFVKTAKAMGLTAWGFWVLDQAIKRDDWMAAVAEEPKTTPIEVPTTKTISLMKTNVDTLRVRDAIIPSVKYGATPGVTYPASNVLFTLPKGSVVELLEEIKDGKNIWVRVGQRQYVAKIYDDFSYLI